MSSVLRRGNIILPAAALWSLLIATNPARMTPHAVLAVSHSAYPAHHVARHQGYGRSDPMNLHDVPTGTKKTDKHRSCCQRPPKDLAHLLKDPSSDTSPYNKRDRHVKSLHLTGLLLFDLKHCPVPKTKEDICAALVDSGLTKAKTSLYVVPPGYNDHSEGSFPVHFDDLSNVQPKEPGRAVVDSHAPTFIAHRAISHTFADFVVVSKGCCQNVYTNVVPGDVLSSQCTNPLLLDQSNLNEFVNQFTILTPGDAELDCPTQTICELPRGVVIGNNYKSTYPITVARFNQADIDGPLDKIGLLVGGTIVQGGNINVVNGVVQAAPSPNINRIIQPVTLISQERITEVKEMIEARVCSLSNQLARRQNNGVVSLSLGGDSKQVFITCYDTREECVVTLKEKDLNSTLITIENPSGNAVIINVYARFPDFRGTTVSYSNLLGGEVVWNFATAEMIFTNVSQTALIAPKATLVEVTMPLAAAVLMGKRDSHLKFTADSIELQPRFLPPQSVEETTTFCDCLCPDEKNSY